ncbi:LacI family DNA-binding transcriptional regulator [Mucilaginibacter xinganensis]|uniref:Transcriptional regulator, LacI family n=1 Tax=Mucilaginibacter xinganensis TaxID=1234841 RepID=A0A223NW15_9SPHI|nr:LacI family DNA-binding transcriptional regulator [Mucilaginibacter xinganensis]ASU34062.1 transcriptional regulator, LacI family [Mucilaginibacter xinganensis]
MGSVNIKKLALELNLSAATVSRALHDSYEISTETKQRVWALAKALNYQPNHFASNLRQQKSMTIAVIVPEVANNFFSQAINGIEEIARLHDYHVLIYQTHESTEKEIALIKRLLSGRVDGILISVASNANDSEHFKELITQLPLVFFDRLYEDIEAITVTTDDYESAFNATQHLVDCNCKKIAYLQALNNLSTGKKRLAGYLDALKNNGIISDEALIIKNCDDENKNYEQVKGLLITHKPDGIIASIEDLALPCYYACNDLNLNIPADVKIVSFSNLKTAPLLKPSLTTITQPAFQIGKEAATILFSVLNKKDIQPNETKVLKSTLMIRESTGMG